MKWRGFLATSQTCYSNLDSTLAEEFGIHTACNLLLVEDDALSRRDLIVYLQQSTYNVFQADTGKAALELMSQVNFDVVISDLRLVGGINGIDVLRHHSRMLPGKRRVLLTAFGSDEVRAEAEMLGGTLPRKAYLYG